MNISLKLLIFSFFFLVYFSSSGGHLASTDGVHGYLLTENLVLRHAFDLSENTPAIKELEFDTSHFNESDRGPMPNGLMYSRYGPLHSILATPIYFITLSLGFSPLTSVPLFFNSIVGAFIGLTLFCFATKVYNSEKIAFITVLFLGVTSLIWVHTALFTDQLLAALTLIVSVYFLYCSEKNQSKKYPIIAGVFVVLAIFARVADLILIVGIMAYGIYIFKKDVRKIISFLLPISIGFVLFGFYNEMRTGSFTKLSYGGVETLSLAAHSGTDGLYGLFVSPGAGIFLYFPLTILIPLGFYWFYKIDRKLFILSLYTFVSLVLFFGTATWDFPAGWWGKIWGPRYLIPALPFISLILGAVVMKFSEKIYQKIILVSLGITGFIVNLIGSLTYFMYGYAYAWAIDELWKYPDNISIMLWDPNFMPLIEHIKVLSSDFLLTAHLMNDSYLRWGLSPCLYDVYLYCQYGILSILILSLIITIIGLLIFKSLRIKIKIS